MNEETRQQLLNFYERNSIPHLLFYGPCFATKKQIVDEFIQHMFHNDASKIRQSVLNINCAVGNENKGIRYIRDNVKLFARQNVLHVQCKVVLFLNAEHLTMDAQSALRRCMELYSHSTRVFMIAETKNNLLPPILSRLCCLYIQPNNIQPNNNSSSSLPCTLFKNTMIQTKLQQYFSLQDKTQDKIQDRMGKTTRESIHELVQDLICLGGCGMDVIEFVQGQAKRVGPGQTKQIAQAKRIEQEQRQEQCIYLLPRLFTMAKEVRNEKLLIYLMVSTISAEM